MMSLEEIEDAVASTGLDRGSAKFRHEVLKRQVEQCQQARGVSECSVCSYAPSCGIRIKLWRAEVLGAQYIDED